MSDLGEAMTELIPRLRRFARGLTGDPERADDLVQDTLERAWTRAHLWRRERGELRSWLFTILRNLDRNDRRSAQRRPGVSTANTEELAQPIDEDATDAVFLAEVRGAVARLPREQREVILLVAVEQCSYAETAAILDVPMGTVMSRLSRARERLRTEMGEHPGPRIRRVK